MLKGMHKGERHIGKTPPGHSDVAADEERLKRLRQDLAQAVKDENFEAAAHLRDQVRALEQQTPSSTPDAP